MLSNYHTLSYVVAGLNSTIRGTSIQSVFSQEKDELVMTVGEPPVSLVISCRPDTNTLYLHRAFARAKKNSAAVLRSAWEKDIRSVSIQPADREVIFDLGSGLRLIAQFFGSKSNVLLVGKDALILDSFRDAQRLSGILYTASSQAPLYDLTGWRMMLDQSPEATLAVVTRKAFPTFGKTVVIELLHRAGIPPTTMCSAVGGNTRTSIEKEVRQMAEEMQDPHPRVYETDGRSSEPVFSIVRLTHLAGHVERTFQDVHEAIRFCVSRSRSARFFTREVESLSSTLEKDREKTLRGLAAVKHDLEGHDRAADYEKYGKLLMRNPDNVRGREDIMLPGDSGLVTIPLDRKLTTIQNAQRYFEKAKRARLAREQTLRRREELMSRATLTERLLAGLEAVESRDDLKNFMQNHLNELGSFGVGGNEQQKNELPFRVFTVDGGFRVLAGKSSTNNDLLTMKYAKPNDLWFHARGSSGSHVVLKIDSGRGEPGKKAKEQAAAIAAYYSKMRGAKFVPVAMTERKYVRKPKGAPAGTVVLEREKVVFAEPALPEGLS